ncbi:MAG: hypothetical protein AAGB19_01175 [Cyanobacteria bacterium P01_F01_bin.3]
MTVRRSMAESVLLWACSLSILILIIGLVTSFFTGSGKALEFGPFVSFLGRVGGWLSNSAEEASLPDDDPRSFAEIARDSLEKTGESLADAPIGEVFELERPLLAVCDDGSVISEAISITAMQADALKSAWESGERPTHDDLISELGNPNCTLGHGEIKRWLGPSLRIIDAHSHGNGEGAILRFHNF